MKPQEAYLAVSTFPQLGVRRALALWKSNIKNPHELSFISDKDILELPGIDKVGLAEIRAIYPIRNWTRDMEKQHKAILEEVSMTDNDPKPIK